MRDTEMAVKRVLMRLPQPVWLRVAYPLWLRWIDRRAKGPSWRFGSYSYGDVARWRGVWLVCCTAHYAGQAADHPWDPGHGWSAERANALWEPRSGRDRLLLRLVGDPRRPVPAVRLEER